MEKNRAAEIAAAIAADADEGHLVNASKEPALTFAWETLETMLSTVEHAIGKGDDGRANLCGVLLEREGTMTVTATATDGRRLAQAKSAIYFSAMPLPNKGFLLSRADVERIISESKRLAKIRKPGTPMANATIERAKLDGDASGPGSVLVLTESFDGADRLEIRCKALMPASEFPNYKPIVPKLDVYAAPVSIDGRFLAEMGKALGGLGQKNREIVMRTADVGTPIRFDVRSGDCEAFEIVMPIRPD